MRGPGRQEGISTDVTPGPIGVENGAAGFSGKLRNFPLLDIIQMACVARRDGRLLVRRRGETGEIVLRDGRIIADGRKNEVFTSECISGLFGVPLRISQQDGYFHIQE